MSASQLSGFRLKLFRALQLLVPEGSSLDAVFNSYDDWRRFRAAHSSQQKRVAAAPASSAPSSRPPQPASQPDSTRN